MDWKFLVGFLVALALLLGIVQIPLDLLQEFKVFTASFAVSFWGLFGVPVQRSGVEISLFHVPMVITLECTALHYLCIYDAAVIAYHRHSLRYRVIGVAAGSLALLLLNLFRIGVLGAVGRLAPSLFDFVHLYLWQGTFALLVFLLWVLWVGGRSARTAITGRPVLLALAGAGATVLLLLATLDVYAAVLASAANALFHAFRGLFGVDVSAAAKGSVIAYLSGPSVIYNKISLDVFNAVIFGALAAATASQVPRPVFLKRLATGAGMLFLQHLGYVVLYGVLLMRGTAPDTYAIVMWIAVGFSMASPLIIWLMVTIAFKPPQAASHRT